LARFLVTRTLSEFAASLPETVLLPAIMVMLFRKETYTHVLASVDTSEGTKWTDAMIPEVLLFEGYERPAALD
jgi:hypothetical protein